MNKEMRDILAVEAKTAEARRPWLPVRPSRWHHEWSKTSRTVRSC